MATRAQVRSQLVAFLQSAQIDQLNQVFSSFPKRINFQVAALPGQKSRAAAVVFIESEHEYRLALGGAHNGTKRIDYTVVLQLFHHSMQNLPQDAMDDFDRMVDDVKALLRSDHNFGDTTGTLVWQGAEPDIDVSYGVPKLLDGGASETWAEVRFVVTQILNA